MKYWIGSRMRLQTFVRPNYELDAKDNKVKVTGRSRKEQEECAAATFECVVREMSKLSSENNG